MYFPPFTHCHSIPELQFGTQLSREREGGGETDREREDGLVAGETDKPF